MATPAPRHSFVPPGTTTAAAVILGAVEIVRGVSDPLQHAALGILSALALGREVVRAWERSRHA